MPSSPSSPKAPAPAGVSQIRRLRKKTGAGISACRQALLASGDDLEKAEAWLRKKDLSQAAKKSGREAEEGLVASYIHPGGRIGVLLEVNSETDFAARSQEFQSFVRDLSRHIAAMSPLFVSEESIPAETLESERKIFEAKAAERAKKKELAPAIARGMLKKRMSEICLMNQEFAREDPIKKQTVAQALNELISKIGENIIVRRFARFALGENKQGESKQEQNKQEQSSPPDSSQGNA